MIESSHVQPSDGEPRGATHLLHRKRLEGELLHSVQLHSVSKVFGKGPLAFTALHEASLSVARGEFVMLSGPSGSGKTTLLSIVGAVMTATEGTVRLFGTDITRLPERELPAVRAALIGFVFQGHNLIGALDAEENVALVARLRGLPGKRARAEARDLLAQVGLADRLHHRPRELSGGQRQRVAVARALAGDPPLLLADEPTASLDAVAGLEITRMMLSLCRERQTTALIVTHDHRIVPLADRLVHIEDGRIRAEGGGEDRSPDSVPRVALRQGDQRYPYAAQAGGLTP